MSENLALLNGKLVPEGALGLDPSDRGFTLGDGLFETMKWDGARIRCLCAHLARMAHGARSLRIAAPEAFGDLPETLTALCRNNAPQAPAALRLVLTRGPGERGLRPPANPQPLLLARTSPLAAKREPPRLIRVRTIRSVRTPQARFKTLSYLDQIAARIEAEEAGGDDALMANAFGRLVCASAANLVFIHKSGRAATPPLSDGALAGITRGRLLALANGTIEVAPIDADFARDCVAIGLTNALVGLEAAQSLDARPLDPEHAWLKAWAAALD